jgi:hypothetical protein
VPLKRDVVECRRPLSFMWNSVEYTLKAGQHEVGKAKAYTADGRELAITPQMAGHLMSKFAADSIPADKRAIKRYAHPVPVLDSLFEAIREGKERP